MVSDSKSGSVHPEKAAFLGIFLAVLLLQNPIAVVVSSLEAQASGFVFYVKDFLVAFFFGILLMTRRRYDFIIADKIAIVIIAYLAISIAINYKGLVQTLYGIRLYGTPLALYFLGRYYFSDLAYRELRIILIIAVLSVIGTSAFISAFGKSNLLEMNVQSVFEAKGMGWKDIVYFDGFPINFFSFYGGNTYPRLFGPFLDPLTMGFFLVPFLFLSRYDRQSSDSIVFRILYILLIVLLLLSQTRSIFMAFLAAVIYIKADGEGWVVRDRRLALSALLAFIAIGVYIDLLLERIDPSSWGHLNAYANMISDFQSYSVIDFLVGKGFPEDMVFGTESIYLSMVRQNGLIFYMLFNVFIYLTYRNIKRHMITVLDMVVLSSVIVYYLASFTTEHWFATTSSSLFWILLGIDTSSIVHRKIEVV